MGWKSFIFNTKLNRFARNGCRSVFHVYPSGVSSPWVNPGAARTLFVWHQFNTCAGCCLGVSHANETVVCCLIFASPPQFLHRVLRPATDLSPYIYDFLYPSLSLCQRFANFTAIKYCSFVFVPRRDCLALDKAGHIFRSSNDSLVYRVVFSRSNTTTKS